MSVANPILLIVGLSLVIVGAAFAWRAITLPTWTRVTSIVAILMLALAAGDVAVHRETRPTVAVIIDRSPSTRSAAYRDPESLAVLLDSLLPAVEIKRFAFADGDAPLPAGKIDDVSVDHTRLGSFPQADAYVLLSDGRWHDQPPAVGAPVFAVIDPVLRDAVDRAVLEIALRGPGAQVQVRATLPGELESSFADRTRFTSGRPMVSLPLANDVIELRVQVRPADSWPENDVLTLRRPATTATRRVWIGPAPPEGFDTVRPRDASDLLDAAIVVLAGEPVRGAELAAIDAYVRQGGGALLILAGEDAGAAASAERAIDDLSPLTIDPPQPQRRWIILVDASGSMAQPTARGATRWQLAVQAAQDAARALPRQARIDAGGFAASVRWWQRNAASHEIAAPPVAPTGPTNLQVALEELLLDASVLPASVLLISDGRASLDAPAALARRFVERAITPRLLAIDGRPDQSVETFIMSAGGAIMALEDGVDWSSVAIDAVQRDVVGSLMIDEAAALRWLIDPVLPPRTISHRRAGWARDGARILATADAGQPIAAAHTVGLGEVTAVLFAPTDDELRALVERTERQPADPRLSVELTRHLLRATALEAGTPLNNLPLQVQLGERLLDMHQVAPGEYQLGVERSPQSQLVTVLLDDRPIARLESAGSYAMEFDEIGIDYDALQSLADVTGGAVVHEPSPLPIPRPTRAMSLQAPLLMMSALLLVAGLIWWRSGR